MGTAHSVKGEQMSEYIVRETGYPGQLKQEVVAELVRCKECKWYQEGYDIDGKWFTRCNGSVRTYGHTKPNWFCADGERRES